MSTYEIFMVVTCEVFLFSVVIIVLCVCVCVGGGGGGRGGGGSDCNKISLKSCSYLPLDIVVIRHYFEEPRIMDQRHNYLKEILKKSVR